MRFVISLNMQGRRQKMRNELHQALEDQKDIRIVEGGGTKSILVEMPESLAEPLARDMPWVSITEPSEIDLL